MRSAREWNSSNAGTSQSSESASRTIMLKSAATWIASISASSVTPAASTFSASPADSSPGRRVSFSRKPNVARRRSSTGAVRQSFSTASQTSRPSPYDATAPWAFVQKGHWLRDETNPAKSSRSPDSNRTAPSSRHRVQPNTDGRRARAGSAAFSARRSARARSAHAAPLLPRRRLRVSSQRRQPGLESLQSCRRGRGYGLLEELVLREAGCLQLFDVLIRDLVGVQPNLLQIALHPPRGRPIGLRGSAQALDQLVVASVHRAGSATTSASTCTRPSRASDRTASRSSSSSGLSCSATSRNVRARRCRKDPSNRPCFRNGSYRRPRDGQPSASGQIPQRGIRARQTVAPRSISAWADAWKLRQVIGPAPGRNVLRRSVEVEPPTVVAEALPGSDDLRRRGRREHLGGRPAVEPLEVSRDDALDLGLLQHHLRDEDGVRVARPAPGQVTSVLREPGEQGSLHRRRRYRVRRPEA